MVDSIKLLGNKNLEAYTSPFLINPIVGRFFSVDGRILASIDVVFQPRFQRSYKTTNSARMYFDSTN